MHVPHAEILFSYKIENVIGKILMFSIHYLNIDSGTRKNHLAAAAAICVLEQK